MFHAPTRFPRRGLLSSSQRLGLAGFCVFGAVVLTFKTHPEIRSSLQSDTERRPYSEDIELFRKEERRRIDSTLENDPYMVLGIAEDTPVGTLRNRFKQLSLALHPDKNRYDQSANRRYRRIYDAYCQITADESPQKMAECVGTTRDRIFQKAAHQNGMTTLNGGISSRFDEIFGAAAFKPIIGDTAVGRFMRSPVLTSLMRYFFAPSRLNGKRVRQIGRALLLATRPALIAGARDSVALCRFQAEKLANLPLGPEMLGVIGRAYDAAAAGYLAKNWRESFWRKLKTHTTLAGQFFKLGLTVLSSGTRSLQSLMTPTRHQQIQLIVAWRMFEWDTTSAIVNSVSEAFEGLDPGEQTARAKALQEIGEFYQWLAQARQYEQGHSSLSMLDILELACEPK